MGHFISQEVKLGSKVVTAKHVCFLKCKFKCFILKPELFLLALCLNSSSLGALILFYIKSLYRFFFLLSQNYCQGMFKSCNRMVY